MDNKLHLITGACRPSSACLAAAADIHKKQPERRPTSLRDITFFDSLSLFWVTGSKRTKGSARVARPAGRHCEKQISVSVDVRPCQVQHVGPSSAFRGFNASSARAAGEWGSVSTCFGFFLFHSVGKSVTEGLISREKQTARSEQTLYRPTMSRMGSIRCPAGDLCLY